MKEGFVTTSEEEARAMVERMGGKVIIEPEGELPDETLSNVSGGGKELIGSKVYVNGELDLDCYKTGRCGIVRGTYEVQRYLAGKPAEYLLYYNVGWVEASSVEL